MTEINGGFFWGQVDSCVKIDGPYKVTNCTFIGRPRWWQITRWYRAVKLWLALWRNEEM